MVRGYLFKYRYVLESNVQSVGLGLTLYKFSTRKKGPLFFFFFTIAQKIGGGGMGGANGLFCGTWDLYQSRPAQPHFLF